MIFKVDTKGSTKSNAAQDQDNGAGKGYPRDSKENKYFKEIQVSDVKSIITEDFLLYVDADSLCYKAAAVQDEPYIIVTNKETGETSEFKNKTEFKGRARGDKISQDSFLGRENLKREAKGVKLLEMPDFEISPKQRLKVDGNIENAKTFIKSYVDAIKFQTGVDNLKFLIGSGSTFREDLSLPQKYKGNRDGQARPLLLKDTRAYLNENYPCDYEDAKVTGLEVDDRISMLAWAGYIHYRKTGKFNVGQAGIDKDQYGTPSIIFNWDKNGVVFKLPQFVLVEASDKGIGTIEMVGSDCKCTGLLQVCYQVCTQDSADNYAAYLKFPKTMHPKSAYSDAGFFKEFYPLESPVECLQKVVDRFYEWFPQGLQYTDWKEKEVDCDTLTWVETLFSCVYMKRRENDPTTFKVLCDKLVVDTSAIVNNNTMTAPKLTFNKDGAKENVDKLKASCENMLPDLKGFKAKKKGDLVELIEAIVENHTSVIGEFDVFYEMKQEPKELPLVVDTRSVSEVLKAMPEYSEYNDGELLEVIVDCGKVIWEDNYIDEHRWFNLRETVVEVDEIFIKFDKYHFTGDHSMCDMDLEYNLGDFIIVQKQSRTEEVVFYK